jgi:hypothetical protein
VRHRGWKDIAGSKLVILQPSLEKTSPASCRMERAGGGTGADAPSCWVFELQDVIKCAKIMYK